MSKRCVYLSEDAEWVINRMKRLARQYDINGLSVSAILAAGLDALNDCNEVAALEHLKWARDSRWEK